MLPKSYFVYIMASETGTLYTGVSGALEGRVWKHKNGIFEKSFSKKYKCDKLVYFEETTDVRAALEREKQIKRWSRHKKEFLIKTINPQWKDLSVEWFK
ncbi:MAG: GIY-YIG nuclease family protein [Patescibacteria group bacterium]